MYEWCICSLNERKRRLFIYASVISVHIKSLTWMISVHVKEIISKILRSNHLSHASMKRNLRFSHCCMQKREKIHKLEEKDVKVECANIQIFARTQYNLSKKESRKFFSNGI